MDNLENISLYAKIIVGVIGAITTFGKLRNSFTSIKRKQELKLDLEIFKKIKTNEEFQSKDIEDKIKEKLNTAFDNNSDNIINFITGIVTFVGFGFWSVDIFRNSEKFNGWIILTLLLSLIGLIMIFSSNENKKNKSKGLFFQIGLYDKENFLIGTLITLFTGILTPILILKINGFSFWEFISGLFFVIGVGSILSNIKRIK